MQISICQGDGSKERKAYGEVTPMCPLIPFRVMNAVLKTIVLLLNRHAQKTASPSAVFFCFSVIARESIEHFAESDL